MDRLPFVLAAALACGITPAYAAEVDEAAAPAAGAETEATDQPDIIVTGVREKGYKRDRASSATKIDAPLRDIPQTVNVVTREVIEDQRALSIQDVLKNVPGVGFSSGDGQRDQVSIRGFTAIADQFVDGMRDDALYFRDLSNIERVEIIKGPASVLYGRGSSGGLINRVRKIPRDTHATLIGSFGSFENRRGEFDVGVASGMVAGRLTGAVEKADSYRDKGFLDRKAIAPSLLFKPATNLSLLLQADYLDDERITDFGIPAFQGRPVDVDPSTYYGAANARDVDTSRSKVWSAGGQIAYQIAAGTQLRNSFRYYDYQLRRNNTLVGSVNEVAKTASLNRSNVNRDEHGWFNQTEVTHDVELGSTRHQLLAGVEFGRQVKGQFFATQNNIATVDLFNPMLPVLPLLVTVAPSTNNVGYFRTAGVYAQDLVSIGDHLKALVGVRWDRFSQRTEPRIATQPTLSRTDRKVSPRAGLVWQPDSRQAYYASWSRSFQPSGESFPLAANNTDIEPERTTNYELGAKYDFFDKKLSATVSVFRLQREGIKTTDPVTKVLIPIGTQRTDGVELSATADLSDGWAAVAGYAFLDAKVIKSIGVDSGQPIEGKRATITPKHSANLWLTKSFGDRYGFGFGGNYVGERFANPGNTVRLPSYFTADAMAWTRVGPARLQLNATNLLNRRYIVSGHGTNGNLNVPGAPRAAMLTVRFDR
ncbi:MAG TPA: TonB-dependent siderophore receptor [Sphingomicrobium sp.]|jgi:catecholate siderophore receptor